MAKIIGKGSFGADSSKEGAQSVTKTSSVTENVALDKDGEVVGVALTQAVKECTFEVLLLDGEEIPVVGETYEGGTVTSVTEDSSNSSHRKITVTTKVWGKVGGGAA